MLPQRNRLRREIGVGKKVGEWRSSSLLFKVFVSKDSQENPSAKISFIVPKKTEKLATKRNAIRRIGYEVLKDFLPSISPNHILIFLVLCPLGGKSKKNLRALFKKELEELLFKIKTKLL